MNRELSKGTELTTIAGYKVILSHVIGEGGHSNVYNVLYKGEHKAAKFYNPHILGNMNKNVQHFQHVIRLMASCPGFLHPVDIIHQEDIIGVVMDYIPEDYQKLDRYLHQYDNACFPNYRVVVRAAIDLTNSLRHLHCIGCYLNSLTPWDIVINPKTGKTIICNFEDVAFDYTKQNFIYKSSFSAPELIRDEAMPSPFTDRFSLAVIIFIMLTMTHPLEGRRFLNASVLTPNVERELYGTEPIFIFDPDDTRNRPVEKIHVSLCKIWPELPEYMQNMFIRQFSKEVMMNPQRRATEGEWLDLLSRFSSEIIPCPSCGGESFGYGSSICTPICSCCEQPMHIPAYATSKRINYPIPLVPGSIIYPLQLAAANIDTACLPVLWARPHPKDSLKIVLTNISERVIACQRSDLPLTAVKPNNSIIATPGTVIYASHGKLEIINGSDDFSNANKAEDVYIAEEQKALPSNE